MAHQSAGRRAAGSPSQDPRSPELEERPEVRQEGFVARGKVEPPLFRFNPIPGPGVPSALKLRQLREALNFRLHTTSAHRPHRRPRPQARSLPSSQVPHPPPSPQGFPILRAPTRPQAPTPPRLPLALPSADLRRPLVAPAWQFIGS